MGEEAHGGGGCADVLCKALALLAQVEQLRGGFLLCHSLLGGQVQAGCHLHSMCTLVSPRRQVLCLSITGFAWTPGTHQPATCMHSHNCAAHSCTIASSKEASLSLVTMHGLVS